jgi:putative transposase
MEQRRVRKTHKYRLKPTLEQERALERVLWRRRMLYNTALDERKTAWERCRISVNYYQQKAELPDLKADFPAYTEVHSQVLQDVLLRLDRAFQAFFRRLQAGEQPGYPRFHGPEPLPQLHLSPVQQWCRVGRRYHKRSQDTERILTNP